MGRFDRERAELVGAIRERGILDERVLRAIGRVERHLFVQEPFLNRAYEDTALPIGKGQTISQPYTVAVMTESLDVDEGDKILEIGTGSGYQAAILAEMGAKVYSIERDMDLLVSARKILDQLGYRVASKGGDGTVGWQEFAPYQGIIVTAGAPDVPKPLFEQCDEGGRLVIPIGGQEIQSLWVLTRRGRSYDRRVMDGFKFVPLIGKMGWS